MARNVSRTANEDGLKRKRERYRNRKERETSEEICTKFVKLCQYYLTLLSVTTDVTSWILGSFNLCELESATYVALIKMNTGYT